MAEGQLSAAEILDQAEDLGLVVLLDHARSTVNVYNSKPCLSHNRVLRLISASKQAIAYELTMRKPRKHEPEVIVANLAAALRRRV